MKSMLTVLALTMMACGSQTSQVLTDEPTKSEETKGVLKYEEALRLANAEQKPLLIYIGSSSCGPCKKMKEETLHPMVEEGFFRKEGVIVTFVDQDLQPEIANSLKVGITIPQTFVFKPNSQGVWKRSHLTGRQTRPRIIELLQSLKETVVTPVTK